MAVKPLRALPVYFSPKQVALNNPSFSPSAGKPGLVVESWKQANIPMTIIAPTAVTRDELALAHDRRYVDAVLDLRADNGFDNRSPDVAAALPWTSGSMTSAALEAFRNRQVAVSPTSGFHHAHYRYGEGYCTFNGLIVAARKLVDAGAKTVGILDLDQHYGNGTDNIIRALRIDFIRHYTLGATDVGPSNAGKWLRALPKIIKDTFGACDILLFQAGADPHINDPLGGRLTTAQMKRRDEIVFETCKDLELPVAWNLAGGYQENIRNVLDLHDNTAKACADVYVFGD